MQCKYPITRLKQFLYIKQQIEQIYQIVLSVIGWGETTFLYINTVDQNLSDIPIYNLRLSSN